MITLKTLIGDAYRLTESEKKPIFLADFKLALSWHYKNSKEWRKFSDQASFAIKKFFQITEVPFIPVSLFKTMKLISVPERQIVKRLFSSSTSGTPSQVVLDQETIDRQNVALRLIMTSFIGQNRRPFIIFDTEKIIESVNQSLNSRGTAVRGMLPFAKSFDFVLGDNLDLDVDRLMSVSQKIAGQEVCIFGFTWMIYEIYLKHKNDKNLHQKLTQLGRSARLVHIGGWKKLQEAAVDKKLFNRNLGQWFGMSNEKIIDIYGMTEQLGTVYPDCSAGFKHVPNFAEILIRDPGSLQVVPDGRVGLIQLLSPLPHSYPGISIISDDLGRVMGIDDCKCGRRGRYFVFDRRSETAELKGCGDAISRVGL